MSGDIFDDVQRFNRRFGAPAPMSPSNGAEVSHLRMRLITEEHGELLRAVTEGRLTEIVGETVDCIYVLVGLLVELGIPLRPFWDAVHAANMQKEPCPNGGKVRKPEGWAPADLKQVLLDLRRDWMADPDGPEMG